MRPAVALVLLVAAGCVGATQPAPEGPKAPDATWAERALPYGSDHDHFKIGEHRNFTTPNFDILGHNPLVSPSLGRTPGGHFCGDATPTPGGRRLAAVEMRSVGGFALADVTNPAKPAWLGEFVMRGSRVYDMAVVPDGRHVLLVTTDQLPSTPAPAFTDRSAGLYWDDACTPDGPQPVASTEDPVPRPMSFLLVSIEDPKNPAIIDQRAIPRSGHSVFATVLDGRTLVMLSVYGATSPLPQSDTYQFYEIAETPLGARLQLLSTFQWKDGSPLGGAVRVHDGWIQKHPKTGKTIAYAAGGDDFFILDLTDLRNPRQLGHWSDVVAPRRGYMGSLHSVFPLGELWDGRHYTLLGPEFGTQPGEHPSGTLWVLDTTDPTGVTEVAAWTLPHSVEWNGTYMFSNHYFSVVDRTAFTSMYHGGVWAIDLSGVRGGNFSLLPSIGVFAPDTVSEKPPATLLRWTPNFQEVLPMPDGSLVTFDGASGLYTFRFDATDPMPAPEPWPLKPVARR